MTVCFVYLKGPLFHDAFGSHTFFITNKKPYTFELHAWNRTYYAWMTCKLCWHKNLSIGDWQNKAHSGMATIVCEFGAENCADHVAHDPPWTISTGANNLFVVCHNQGGMLEQKENCGIQTGVMSSVRQPFSDSRGHFCKSIMDGL